MCPEIHYVLDKKHSIPSTLFDLRLILLMLLLLKLNRNAKLLERTFNR